MTDNFRDLHRVYDAARQGELGGKLWCVAHAADAAWQGAAEKLAVNWKGLAPAPLAMPKGDRAESLVAHAFAAIAAENGFDWRKLVAAAWAQYARRA